MNTTFHPTTRLSWSTPNARQQRRARFGHTRIATSMREIDTKQRGKRFVSGGYREVLAAWSLIAVVAAAIFGTDFLVPDRATACVARVVAPQTHNPNAESAYDHGERLDRLDWDRDINAGGSAARRPVPNPVGDCPLP